MKIIEEKTNELIIEILNNGFFYYKNFNSVLDSTIYFLNDFKKKIVNFKKKKYLENLFYELLISINKKLDLKNSKTNFQDPTQLENFVSLLNNIFEFLITTNYDINKDNFKEIKDMKLIDEVLKIFLKFDMYRIYKNDSIKLLNILENPYNGMKNTLLILFLIYTKCSVVTWGTNIHDFYKNLISNDKEYEDFVKIQLILDFKNQFRFFRNRYFPIKIIYKKEIQIDDWNINGYINRICKNKY
jgi:hypothetical protein